MGKATILPSGARDLQPGQYRVRIEKDNARAAQDIKNIETELLALDAVMPSIYANYNDSLKIYNNANSDLSEVIKQSKESPEADYSSKLSAATKAERAAHTNLAQTKSRYQATRIKEQALKGKKLYLNAKVDEDIRTVWCADCQRGLSGEVATIEIPNMDSTILIRPGGADGDGSEYSSSRDGQLRSVASMSPAEVAWNYALFPGWQKFKPLYRIGTITERLPDNSKCSVLLDAYSTVQSLSTDITRKLTNVPMVYKNRDDGGPYVIGDRVVIEFQNQNQESPRVVGFEQDPCTTSSTTTSTPPPEAPGIFQITYSGGILYKFVGWTNEVFETQGNPIGGRWRGACLGPSGMIAAEWQTQDKLYQFSGVSTVVDSIIGSTAGLTIFGLYYDSDTTNLLSIDNLGTLSIHDGISTTVSSTMIFPYADSTSGFVTLSGVCVYSGDLVMSVYWFSIASGTTKAQLWRMDGYSTTIKSVLADYSHIWNAVLAHPFTYTGGFAFHIFGLNTMLKFEVSPPGPGATISDFAPGWPAIQFVGGGYAE